MVGMSSSISSAFSRGSPSYCSTFNVRVCYFATEGISLYTATTSKLSRWTCTDIGTPPSYRKPSSCCLTTAIAPQPTTRCSRQSVEDSHYLYLMTSRTFSPLPRRTSDDIDMKQRRLFCCRRFLPYGYYDISAQSCASISAEATHCSPSQHLLLPKRTLPSDFSSHAGLYLLR